MVMTTTTQNKKEENHRRHVSSPSSSSPSPSSSSSSSTHAYATTTSTTIPTCTLADGRSTVCGRAVYESWTDLELEQEFYDCYPDLVAKKYKLDLQYVTQQQPVSSSSSSSKKVSKTSEKKKNSGGKDDKTSEKKKNASSSTTTATTTSSKSKDVASATTNKATKKTTATAKKKDSTATPSTSSSSTKNTNNNKTTGSNQQQLTSVVLTNNRTISVDLSTMTIPFTSRLQLIYCIMIRDLEDENHQRRLDQKTKKTTKQKTNNNNGNNNSTTSTTATASAGTSVASITSTATGTTTTTMGLVPDLLDVWCTLVGNPKMIIVSFKEENIDLSGLNSNKTKITFPKNDYNKTKKNNNKNATKTNNNNNNSNKESSGGRSDSAAKKKTTNKSSSSSSSMKKEEEEQQQQPKPANIHYWRSSYGRVVKAVDYYGGMYTIRGGYITSSDDDADENGTDATTATASATDTTNNSSSTSVLYTWTGRVKPGFLDISSTTNYDNMASTAAAAGFVAGKGWTLSSTTSIPATTSKANQDDLAKVMAATGLTTVDTASPPPVPATAAVSTSSSTTVPTPKSNNKNRSPPTSTSTAATGTTKTATAASTSTRPRHGSNTGSSGNSTTQSNTDAANTMKLDPELERHCRLSQYMMKRSKKVSSSLASSSLLGGSSGRNARGQRRVKSDPLRAASFRGESIFFKMQMARIRIPKGKRPGDFIKVPNPFLPEYVSTIKIPIGAKGKYFQHPMPVKTRTEEHSLCVVCYRDLEGNSDDSVPLRSCSMVACTSCFEYINGGSCPVCEAPLPSIETIICLPLLFVFGEDKTYELKDVLLVEYYWLKDVENESDDWTDSKQALEDISPQIDALVKRLYRKKSLHLHPDRNPELIEKWALLNKAKAIFSDPKTRRKYINDMIDFICSFQEPDAQSILLFNDQWLEDFDKADVNVQDGPRAERRHQQRPTTNDAPMKALEDGSRISKLKRPRVTIESVSKRKIRVFLNHDRFKNYTQEVTIFGACGRLDGNDLVLKTIEKHQFDEFDDEIRVPLELPCVGMWTLGWQAKLSYMDDGSSSFNTARSTETVVDVGDSKQRHSEAQFVSGLLTSARRRTDALRSAEKLLVAATDRSQIEDRYDELVRCIAKTMDVRARLKQHIEDESHQHMVDVLRALEQALIPAKEVKEKFEDKIASFPKRDKKRAFRRALLEHFVDGDTKTLLEEISIDKLEKLGGDANRFWQILVGVKPSESIDLSSSELHTAEKRKDLFSSKQRSRLMARAKAVALEEAKVIEDSTEESISTKEDSSAGAKIDKQYQFSPVTDNSQGSAPEKSHTALTMEKGLLKPVLADKEPHQEKEVRVHTSSVPSESAGFSSAVSSISAKISPHTELTSIQSSFSPTDVTEAQAQTMKEASFLEGSTSDTPSLQETPSMFLPPLFPSPQNDGSTGAFTQVQDHGPPSLPDVNSGMAAANFPLAFLDRSPGIQSSRDTFADLIGLPMPGATTEESSSHVSGITLDPIDVVRGDEIAFQSSITMNRTTNVIGKSSILSDLLEPSPADPLFTFINKQHACFKVSPESFHQFLLSQDISTMKDLREAMEDDDFVLQDMHDGGLKLYKRKLFLREIEMSM